MKKAEAEFGEGRKVRVIKDSDNSIILEHLEGKEKKHSIRIVPSKSCDGVFFEVTYPDGNMKFRTGYDLDHLFTVLKAVALLDNEEI